MATPFRQSELAFVLGFLAVIVAVPSTQTALELFRHERVQFTDVFRSRPAAKQLRQYEATLEEKSWFQQRLRPVTQQLLFAAFRQTGAKAVPGKDGWLFYRPDVRYLVEPNRLETDRGEGRWVRAPDGGTSRDSVVRAIVRFGDQLRERGIQLLVVPVPGKPSVYPDRLTRRLEGKLDTFRSPTVDLLGALQREGVATVDLFRVFRDERARAGRTSNETALYLAQDTHWTPFGSQLAAQAVAGALRELGWAPPPQHEFQSRSVRVKRWGDVLEMTGVPGVRGEFPAEVVECAQVLDPALGLMAPGPSDRPGTYRYPGQKASVLVLGDSFCRIYQAPEPRSLGELTEPSPATAGAAGAEPATKRLLPGSAGFVSHLALALQSPVDCLLSDGGASTDVRRRLSTDPELLERKRVVVWEFVERDLALGSGGWEEAPLPAKVD